MLLAAYYCLYHSAYQPIVRLWPPGRPRARPAHGAAHRPLAMFMRRPLARVRDHDHGESQPPELALRDAYGPGTDAMDFLQVA
jgi:hypothetical protein